MLHLWMGELVDPVRRPVSLYALDAPGTVLFPVGVVGMAIGAFALSIAKPHHGARAHRLAQTALKMAGAMLVAVAVFPTDAGYQVASWSGQLHRYAAGLAFFLLSAIGCSYVIRERGSTTARARAMRIVVGISASMFIVTVISTFVPAWLHAHSWSGIPQRVLLVSHALMLMLAGAAFRVRTFAPVESAAGGTFRTAELTQVRRRELHPRIGTADPGRRRVTAKCVTCVPIRSGTPDMHG